MSEYTKQSDIFSETVFFKMQNVLQTFSLSKAKKQTAHFLDLNSHSV